MSSSPSALIAATTLAAWAHERRRGWSAAPLPRPMPRAVVVPEVVLELVHDVVVPEVVERDAVELRPVVSAYDITLGVMRRGGAAAVAVLDRMRPLADPAVNWLMRGAAVVSTMSVVLLVGANRGEVVERWNRMSAIVTTATRRQAEAPRPAGPAKGTGRLTIASSNGAAEVVVDGKPRGLAPVTVDLAAGAHRVRLASEKGSVERSVKIQAGELSEMSEAIFPGWVAVTAPVDLTLSEGGRALKRDERGWAILAPGPHDIQLDNRLLGVHDVRHVVVTPGDATKVSFAPPASTISLTTSEPAEVWIDGAAAGETPLVERPIALGVHDVRVRSALHERWLRVRATVTAQSLHVDLSAQPLPETRRQLQQ